jgi:hypothetical protein
MFTFLGAICGYIALALAISLMVIILKDKPWNKKTTGSAADSIAVIGGNLTWKGHKVALIPANTPPLSNSLAIINGSGNLDVAQSQSVVYSKAGIVAPTYNSYGS